MGSLVVRMVVQTVVFLIALGLLLMVPAGTADWPQAWVFLIILAVSSFALGFWLAKADPGLLRERLSPIVNEQQRPWDRLFVAGVMTGFLAWFILMGLEHRRRGDAFPVWVEALGAILVAACMVIAWRTFRVNSFAAPVVKVQGERGQQVISTGPYAIVRHPLYAGAVLWMIGLPLLLGSWWGLPIGLAIVVMVAVRAVGEEQVLKRELAGYEAYMQKVRFRLLPGVW